MIKLFIIFFSILIAVIGYRNAECRRCKYEAILFGFLFFQFKNYEFLGARMLIIFIVGELLIKKFINESK